MDNGHIRKRNNGGEWHSKLIALRCMEGKRLEFRLVENRGTSSRELLLEYILPR